MTTLISEFHRTAQQALLCSQQYQGTNMTILKPVCHVDSKTQFNYQEFC